jgi:hypothetical protein
MEFSRNYPTQQVKPRVFPKLGDQVGLKGEEVLEHMVAEQEHGLGTIQGGDRFKATVGRPDSLAGESMDVRMVIEPVAVTLDCDDDAGDGKAIGGNLLEHLPERLSGRLAEQAEIPAVVFENGVQELGDGEDVLGVADLLQDDSLTLPIHS